ncbi:MAG: hypothetical protein JWR12_3003 [Mucilaginibacter sp.]|nr:hypothetical protein [Mucilaginibacter sp.]
MEPQEKDSQQNAFPVWVMNTGFITGLVLAGLCLILAAYYMIKFQNLTSEGINQVVNHTMANKPVASGLTPTANAQDYQMIRVALATNMYIARVLLLSCGIFTGLAFGFMGFSLFLIGIKGSIDATLSSGEKYKLQVARLSPGLFVILCASILIGVCATRSLPVDMNQSTDGTFHMSKPESKSNTGLEKPDTTMPKN